MSRIYLTERDFELLYTLFKARYMVTPQIRQLFWHTAGPGSLVACQRRLQRLTRHGLIRRIEQPVRRGEGSKPYIYALDKAGAEILSREIGIDPTEIDWKPKPAEENLLFMQHLLHTNDFQIALTLACQKTRATLVSWTGETEIRSNEAYDRVVLAGAKGGSEEVAVIPDGTFVLAYRGRQPRFCLEIDEGTVSIVPGSRHSRGWTQKIRAYMEYYESGLYQKRYATDSLRVLTVTKSKARLAHMKQATEEAGGDYWFWFTTLEQVTAENVLTGKIWHQAASDKTYSLLE